VDERHLKRELMLVCGRENDLFQMLVDSRIPCVSCHTPIMAVQRAAPGAGVLVLADGYPTWRWPITEDVLALAKEKRIHIYVEYPQSVPGLTLGEPRAAKWERAVVASERFGAALGPGRILAIHACRFLPCAAQAPDIAMARVAGFDTAVYGLPEKDVFPILLELPGQNLMVATTRLSQYLTSRLAPFEDWKVIWTTILNWAQPGALDHEPWWNVPLVRPSYAKHESLPEAVEQQAFERGAEWFDKGRLFIHADWESSRDEAAQFEDRVCPFPKPNWPVGDGSLGMLEGYNAAVQLDGSQPLRWWLRNDCMGEAAMPLALWSRLTGNPRGQQVATNLLDFVYRTSSLAQGPRADPTSPSYGLVGWSTPQNEGVYYGDDNARAILGTMAAAALLQEPRWDEAVMRNLLANLRTSGTLGFRRQRIEDPQLQTLGWRTFYDEPYVYFGPHYEAYLWACFLRAYALTGYAPFLERTRTAIKLTVEAYPDEWQWTNGIQQERARMLLPLAWLVRVADTPEHRDWLRTIAQEMLAHQDACGAIREQVGERGKGAYAPHASNEEYGTNEAPLIQQNGDALSDLLYTTNFAFIGLHEAAAATGEQLYTEAEERLAKYLCRIQVRSRAHCELDGAWFRAHDFCRWEYWASSGDAGWGAWSIESGWTQAWITAVLGLRLAKTSLWDVTSACGCGVHLRALLPVMGL
jgi:hypothetical protein